MQLPNAAQDYFGGRTVGGGPAASEEELTGGIGGATPAVWEPRPNFCRVFASSLPDGFRLWDSWNFFMASTVSESHLPLGLPLNEPSFARAL